MIREAEPMADAEQVAEIYNHYVLHDTATFEVDDIGGADMANRIAKVQGEGLPWLVATDSLGVVGFAYAGAFHERAAYVHTLSVSIYLAPGERGRGLGGTLYRELLKRAQAVNEPPHAPIRSLIALIALPNEASVRLHESLGFTKVGVIGDAGRKFGRWIDVGYWQLSCAIPDEA